MSRVIPTMTVAQLRALLRGLPDDMRVLVDGYEGGLDDPSEAGVCPVLMGDEVKQSYSGRHNFASLDRHPQAPRCFVIQR